MYASTYFSTRYCSRATFNRPTACWPWTERQRLPTTVVLRNKVRAVVEVTDIIIVNVFFVYDCCWMASCLLKVKEFFSTVAIENYEIGLWNWFLTKTG